MTTDFAARARALVGIPFRPQGRSRDALDCVGVAVETFGLSGVRRDYRVRGDHADEVRAFLERDFERVPAAQLGEGDLMMMRVAEDQVHLAVRTDLGFVHAHAGLRRVVETPGTPDWPLLGVYRRRNG